MKAYLLRHGITDYNEKHLHDHEDKAMLTIDGKIRSEKIIDFLKDKNIDLIFSSPFKRCIDTVKPFSEYLNIKIIEDKRLGEIILEPMQGKSWKEVSDDYNKKLHDINGEKIDGCEHMSEVRVRVSNFFNEVYQKYPDKNVVICSHAGTIINMLAIFGENTKNCITQLPDNKSYSESTFKILEINQYMIDNINNKIKIS